MEYFFDGFWKNSGNRKCADRECPCEGRTIIRGEGYLYLSEEVVDFRYEFHTHVEAIEEMDRRVREKYGRPVKYECRFGPRLFCKKAAQRHKLDLDIAAADARHWWQTGEAPLRSTPIAGSQLAKQERLDRSKSMR